MQRGKERAYKALFDGYYRPLTAYAMNYLGDMDLSREVVQELFVHLFEKRKVLNIRSSLKAYLYQAVRNRCLNRLQHSSKAGGRMEPLDEREHATSVLEEEIEKNELEYRIFQVIEALPPACRQIFMMSRVRGMSNAEIAAQQNISKRTVETQISRALKSLREKIS